MFDKMFSNSLLKLRSLFYLVTPEESQFEKISDVPEYVNDSQSWFTIFIVIETLILTFKKHKKAAPIRANDAITSVGGGLLQSLLDRIIVRSIQMKTYVWLYQNFHLFDFPWNSRWTWFAAFLGVDCGYYWFHRAAHEVAIFWASHQMHHSSEDYNLSTALRQSAVAAYTSFFFYLPLALIGIPPTVFAVHLSFNLLYQFWIHTELIRRLGPLEYIFNTPSHHRVHHGRNPYCIDKNYAGTLIIWDRMFGTFEAEKDEEPVVYGLIGNVQSFNPLYLQFFYGAKILFEIVPRMPSMADRFKAIFYRPGWEPGEPRTAKLEDYPKIENPVVKYNPSVPLWYEFYVLAHFSVLLALFSNMAQERVSLQAADVAKYLIFIVASLQCFGMLFDGKWYGPMAECMRCTLTLVYLVLFGGVESAVGTILAVAFAASTVLWILNMSAHSADGLAKRAETNGVFKSKSGHGNKVH